VRDVQHAFVAAPPERITAVLFDYQHAAQASDEAAAVVGEIVEAIHAPSRVLTAAADARRQRATGDHGRPIRTAEPGGQDSPGAVTPPGPLRRVLQDLRVTNPYLLERATLLDRASEQLLVDAGEHHDGRREATRSADDLRTSLGTALSTRQHGGPGSERTRRGPAGAVGHAG
jgi:hypothetical protein